VHGSPIQIGSISLQGFEVPASVRFGGRQRLVVHNLAGGQRFVERLGPDDGELAFQGTFSGPNAQARVRAFDNLRLSGAIVWLSWETFRRPVVVKSFIADYHSPWWIPYTVSCVVTHQTGVGREQASTGFSLVAADLQSAALANGGSTVSLSQLQTAISQPNALTVGTSNQAQAIAAVGAALDSVSGQIALQSSLLIGIEPEDSDPENLSLAIASVVTSAGLLAGAVAAGSYIGRIGATLRG